MTRPSRTPTDATETRQDIALTLTPGADQIRSPILVERSHRLRWLKLDATEPTSSMRREARRRWPLALVAIVTLAAVAAILLGPSPRFVSEATFVVRGAIVPGERSFGGAGTQSAMIVATYVRSRDAVEDLSAALPLAEIVGRSDIDRLSRFPPPFGESGAEALFRHMRDRIEVDIDEPSGIVSLRSTAHRPQDAQALTEAMLANAENLVNGLGSRARADTRAKAELHLTAAAKDLSAAQIRISTFRSAAELIDPTTASDEQGALLGSLSAELAALDVEIERLDTLAPASPRLPSLVERRRASAGQLEDLQAERAGAPASLAVKVSDYELLTLRRALATAALDASHRALEGARRTEQTSRLYLERISQPNRPDRPENPSTVQIVLVLAVLAGGGWTIRRRWSHPAPTA